MAKEGGPNPEANSRLRAVIKAANMPKENVERAIKAKDKDTADYKEVLLKVMHHMELQL
jgi:transcriptional/translational regulatory protein YebC/TACO1